MQNLKAEMARRDVTVKAVRQTLGCTEKTVRNKISGSTEFTFPEAQKIRAAYFPDLALEYLFAQESESVSL